MTDTPRATPTTATALTSPLKDSMTPPDEEQRFDLDRECFDILGTLSELLPDQSQADAIEASEIVAFREQATAALSKLQQTFPGLSGKRLGGINRLYLFDPSNFLETLEEDVVEHWLQQPDSLELTAGKLAAVASSWYEQRVSADRIKRRFTDPGLAKRLQQKCYAQGNPADITNCRSLPEIQKKLRLRARRSNDKWTFRGEITFYKNGTVEINSRLTSQDKTAAGKGRIRGNGSAVSVDALRNVLLAYAESSRCNARNPIMHDLHKRCEPALHADRSALPVSPPSDPSAGTAETGSPGELVIAAEPAQPSLSDRIRNNAAARRAAEEVPLSPDGTDLLALI